MRSQRTSRFGIASGFLAASAFVLTMSAAAAEKGEHSDAAKFTTSEKNNDNSSDEVAQLKLQLAAQQQQIEQLHKALERLKTLSAANLTNEAPPATFSLPITSRLGEVASTTAILPLATAALPAAMQPPIGIGVAAQTDAENPSPLQLKIGNASITPVGFMDMTYMSRSINAGGGIGTGFGGIPFGNTPQGKLSESVLSIQNSRIGARVDANVAGSHVIGYWESDFLGNNAGNVLVSSNSYTFRLRLYWVDLRKGNWEFLGGQSWSLMTPGRRGISPLPSDLFYSQDVDVNYQMGLTSGRIPGFRVTWHPTDKIAWALAVENSQQYMGGSSGGGTATLPSNFATTIGSELNNGNTTLNAPSLAPDLISKLAFDPKIGGHALHLELTGLLSEFKVYNPASSQSFTKVGGGGEFNTNLELVKGFHLIENFYYSNGGARYIFGQGPDLIINGNGDIGLLRSGSTVDGIEWQHKDFMLYGYYGGGYFQRAIATDLSNGKPVGYGYPGSSNGNNRTIQEGTVGFQQTFWKNPRYGALQLFFQYSYLFRTPWFVAPSTPAQADTNMVFLNLRYVLPGAAPVVE